MSQAGWLAGSDRKTRAEMRRDRLILVVLMVVPLLVAVGAGWVFDRPEAQLSLFKLTNLVGPTTESLLHGDGLVACSEEMGAPGSSFCFHAARMPLPSAVVAVGIQLLGNHFMRVGFYKLLLLLVPLEIAIFLVWRRLPRWSLRTVFMVLLLLAPFGMTPLLADVVNMQVEEGYCYSFLALTVAILFFGVGWGRDRNGEEAGDGGLGYALLFGVCVDGVYLAKSSMVAASAVLVVAYLFRERRAGLRWLVVGMAVAAPVGWALHQHHASGRYAVGTSLDGINLHKGNNAGFLVHYPPPPGSALDEFDSELNVGHIFRDEWSYNDYHERAAIDYLRSHPEETLRGDVRKIYVLFVTTRKYGSTVSHGIMLKVETAGMMLFRVLLWIAIGCSVYGIVRRRSGWVFPGAVFLCLVGACTAPYMLGFGYTRHVSVLIYPVVLTCCAMLAARPEGRTI